MRAVAEQNSNDRSTCTVSSRTSMARKRRDILAHRDALTAAAVLLFVAQGLWFRRFGVDDAFIAYRCARHLGSGLGPVMNPGERVEGVSNLPWTGLLGGVAALGLEPHAIGPLLSFLCGLTCIGLVSLLASRLLGDRRAGGAAALFLAAAGPLAIWSASGMETSAFTAALILLYVAALRDLGRERGGLGTGVLLGLVAALRPEGLLYAAPLVAAAPRRLRWHLRVWTGAACIIAPLVIFRLLYFHDWLPNPVRAKANPSTAVLGPGILYLLQMAFAFPLHVAAAFLLPKELGRAPRRLLLGGLAVTVCVAVAAGGERLPAYRLLLPAWPVLAVAAEIGLRRLRQAEIPRQIPLGLGALGIMAGGLMLAAPAQFAPLGAQVLRWARTHRDASAYLVRLSSQVRFLGAVLVVVALAAWLYRRGERALRDVEEVEAGRGTHRPGLGRPLHESDRACRAMAVALGLGVLSTLLPAGLDPALVSCRDPDAAVRLGRQVGEWLRLHYPPGTLVATNCAGTVPYFSELPCIDMLGLTDAHIARVRPDRTAWIGHEKGDGEYVLSRRPAIVILGGAEGSAEPWPFPGDQQLAAAPAFHTSYRLQRVPLAGFEFIYFVRTDVPATPGG
jgi:hypothetical protein